MKLWVLRLTLFYYTVNDKKKKITLSNLFYIMHVLTLFDELTII